MLTSPGILTAPASLPSKPFAPVPTLNDKIIQLCRDPENARVIVQCPSGLLPEKVENVVQDPEWLDKALRLYCIEIPDPCDPSNLNILESPAKVGY